MAQVTRSSGTAAKSSDAPQRVEAAEEHRKRRSIVTLQASVPRLALRVGEAAEALGVSEDFFAAEIAPHVPCVRRGRLKLYAIRALEQWLDADAERLLEDRRAA